ncbi:MULTISPECIES: tyrosine-type recombinase/integrase [unclassified Leptospira]|uniref:tyrosine-type recombinase/integrase n=1 Tax=unclassified Leptospira TaxID=2633828 RepID=UPI0002BFA5C9|nr:MULTISPECIES: tyrosine-type recombinase/integrase [unclassified Leptospira]EMJ99471.1 site-specific recombinase, phage integrase family [Leptospira sp. B5-022]MCR1792527.1 site-specific integrase [Leptospira sp. id769339]
MPKRIKIWKHWENGKCFSVVSFSYDTELYQRIRKVLNSRWDNVQRVWKIPFSESFLSEFISDYGERIDADPEIILIPLKTELLRRNYSRKTLRSYFFYNRALLKSLGKNPYIVTESDLKSYLDRILYEKNLASNSIKSILQSLKFYYNIVIGKKYLKTYPYPKREKRIPESLSRSEVARMIESASNLKHRLLLRLCYGAGLRVSELVKLRGDDLDWERKSIRIRQGKGQKDRFTLLPTSCKNELLNILHKQGMRSWIFKGQIPNQNLSVRSAEKIFTMAKVKAGITKDVSIHDLRHAFAIHLLESGTSIKLIQRLLGHVSVKTTEIYARIVDPMVSKIKSPLDEL